MIVSNYHYFKLFSLLSYWLFVLSGSVSSWSYLKNELYLRTLCFSCFHFLHSNWCFRGNCNIDFWHFGWQHSSDIVLIEHLPLPEVLFSLLNISFVWLISSLILISYAPSLKVLCWWACCLIWNCSCLLTFYSYYSIIQPDVKLTTHLDLVSRLRMSSAFPSLFICLSYRTCYNTFHCAKNYVCFVAVVLMCAQRNACCQQITRPKCTTDFWRSLTSSTFLWRRRRMEKVMGQINLRRRRPKRIHYSPRRLNLTLMHLQLIEYHFQTCECQIDWIHSSLTCDTEPGPVCVVWILELWLCDNFPDTLLSLTEDLDPESTFLLIESFLLLMYKLNS